MPGENIQDWSVTAASNGTADTLINWAEGMPRASVNDSARSMMAAHAKERNLWNGSIVTTGAPNVQAFTSGKGYTTIPTGLRVTLQIGAGLSNTGATTLNMDGTGAKSVVSASGAALVGGELLQNLYFEFLYNGAVWLINNAPSTGGGQFLPGTGGTVTGDINISKASPTISLNKTASGQPATITGTLNGLSRWQIQLGDATAEGSGVLGSNFDLINFDNAGSFLSTVLNITRANIWTAAGTINVTGNSADPLRLTSAAGNNCQIYTAVPAGRTWSAGTTTSGTYLIADITGGVGMVEVVQGYGPSLLVGSGIRYQGISGANFIGFRYNVDVAGTPSAVIDSSVIWPIANATSDERMKQDIAPSTLDCLAEIAKIQLYEYRWKEQTAPGVFEQATGPLVPVGFVAQRLLETTPYAVAQGNNTTAPFNADNQFQPWNIQANNMMATLVGAVQQLSARVAALEAQLATRANPNAV
jgi:hypothetical protein